MIGSTQLQWIIDHDHCSKNCYLEGAAHFSEEPMTPNSCSLCLARHVHTSRLGRSNDSEAGDRFAGPTSEAWANHHEPVPHHDRLPELGALMDEGALAVRSFRRWTYDIHTHTHRYRYTFIYIYIHTYIYTYFIYIYIYIYTDIHMYLYMLTWSIPLPRSSNKKQPRPSAEGVELVLLLPTHWSACRSQREAASNTRGLTGGPMIYLNWEHMVIYSWKLMKSHESSWKLVQAREISWTSGFS